MRTSELFVQKKRKDFSKIKVCPHGHGRMERFETWKGETVRTKGGGLKKALFQQKNIFNFYLSYEPICSTHVRRYHFNTERFYLQSFVRLDHHDR